MKATLTPGITHTMRYKVPDSRTVPQLLPESKDFAAMPQVLATGYLVGIIEWACIEALHGHLDDDELTLGTHVDVSHAALTVPGSTVTIDVQLVAVEGRALRFAVEARDEHAVISAGQHQRGVVVRDRFETRIAGQAAKSDLPG